MGFPNHLEISETFLPEATLQKCKEDLRVMRDYLQNNCKNFRHALENMNISDLHLAIVISEKWRNLLQQIKTCYLEDDSMRDVIPDVQNIVTHSTMLSEITTEISKLEARLNVELINDETTRFQPKREELYQYLRNLLNKLKEINEKLNKVLSQPVNVKESEERLKNKVQRIKDTLRDIAGKSKLNQVDCDLFRKYYQHLIAIGEYLGLPDVEIREQLDQAKTKVFEKVTCLCDGFVATTGKEFEKAAELLIEMKSLAENLTMFDREINEKVDDSLKFYREKFGAAPLSRLTMILERSEVGMRIICEHALLQAENWRHRNIKTQAQNNIEYVLNSLEGDDIDRDILTSRYETFQTNYDEILKRNIGKEDEKSTVNTLASNLKLFVDKLRSTSESTVMSTCFRDGVPEILAHIFAIWTLQNTEYYNEMRGIEAQDTFLLRPHVAQIIAIFRILGIGYQRNVRINDVLFNNLVEIKTGEGKSVVLAAVACIFALADVDVSCSCYSSDLSTRDKEAFSPLFQILGVSERIDYGTFNRLCENLLNEQCNVREKVCDMISNNKNVLEVVTYERDSRQKVLLIDEVDVFLSDKYYGGVYVPVVHLKHPSIKALLDQI